MGRKKFVKNEAGVSGVVAIILMVSIVVVSASSVAFYMGDGEKMDASGFYKMIEDDKKDGTLSLGNEVETDDEEDDDEEILTIVSLTTGSVGLANNGFPCSKNIVDSEVEIYIAEDESTVDNNDANGESGNVIDIAPDVIYASPGDIIEIEVIVYPDENIDTACFDDLQWDSDYLELQDVERGDLFSNSLIWIENIDEKEFVWGSTVNTNTAGTYGTFLFKVLGDN